MTINTGGGAYVGRDVTTGGDFVGRDKNEYAGEVSHSVFDQRGQHVNYQYNAAGNINFGAVQNQLNLADELEKLQAEVVKAHEANVLNAKVATDVKYRIEQATNEAKEPAPDKKTIVDYLNQAKTILAGVTAAAGLVTGLSQAIAVVSKLF